MRNGKSGEAAGGGNKGGWNTGAVYLVADCGSTTTKVVLFGPGDGGYSILGRSEAPTTVENPVNDVCLGLWDAVKELAAATGYSLTDEGAEKLLTPARGDAGCDGLLCCSSAGGGLQMLVMGAVRSLTAESAAKAALGAGAIVTEVLACNDTRSAAEQIVLLRRLQPDMVLLSGGVDGGATEHVLQLAELLRAARLRPRHGDAGTLPLIFAGNRDAREAVVDLLDDEVTLALTENIRPTLEVENLAPAREKIHTVFMEHVMSRAPGYTGLMEHCCAPILPTPAACGEAVRLLAEGRADDVLAVDIGGATTDIFSVVAGELNRTVSANLGLSYSIANVCHQSGWARVRRWLPHTTVERELRNRVLNKMIRPTTLPFLLEELYLEQAIAREAMALALDHHRRTITELKGIRQQRSVGEAFRQRAQGANRIAMDRVGLIVGRGGVLTHAPRSAQAALMLMDAFGPQGVTELALDAANVLPQLGVLATVAADAAREVLRREALLPLGVCVAPLTCPPRAGPVLARVRFVGGGSEELDLVRGRLGHGDLPAGSRVTLAITPVAGVDCGSGPGRTLRVDVRGGACGVILDGRERGAESTQDADSQREWFREWYRILEMDHPSDGETEVTS